MPNETAMRPAEKIMRDADYTKILAETLMSGVSILDEDMNYLFISDSVYKSIGVSHEMCLTWSKRKSYWIRL